MGAFGFSVEFIKTHIVLLLGYNRDKNIFFPRTMLIHEHVFISNMLTQIQSGYY